MSEAKIAATQPAVVELEAGKTYYFCTCGQSRNQPFCDGSHQGSGFTPLIFEAEKSGTQFLCQCKRTKTAPFCDGSHNDLPD